MDRQQFLTFAFAWITALIASAMSETAMDEQGPVCNDCKVG